MPDVRALAAAYGVRVEVIPLGDWGRVTLVAEYDPDGPVIRVDERAAWRTLRQAQGDDGRAVERAIAHELYHHREAIGEVPRTADRRAREAAADAFAEALVNSAPAAVTNPKAASLANPDAAVEVRDGCKPRIAGVGA